MSKNKQVEFNITSICRDDLEGVGFNTSKVSDDTMTKLASKMADDYCEQLFWDSMKIIAQDYFNIPMRRRKK